MEKNNDRTSTSTSTSTGTGTGNSGNGAGRGGGEVVTKRAKLSVKSALVSGVTSPSSLRNCNHTSSNNSDSNGNNSNSNNSDRERDPAPGTAVTVAATVVTATVESIERVEEKKVEADDGGEGQQDELDAIFDDNDDFVMLSQTDNSHRRTPLRHEGSSRTDSAPRGDDSLRGPSRNTSVDSDGEPLDEVELRAQRRNIFCNIHGHIEFEPALVDIIDTPEFQRLRGLQQLGGTSYVFPGACHTRFSHCLGVSYLAGAMIDHLRAQDDNALDITHRDRLCVKLAGLCHDLGHGPFSHTFEMFVNRVRNAKGQPLWHHEDASLKLFDKLLVDNNIDLGIYDLQLPEDTNFIKRLIQGLSEDEPWPTDIGRPESKRFLFDIVANKRNGIDVDKLDYFMRDSVSALGDPPIGCDVRRLIKSSRVCTVNNHPAICFEEKMALGILELFRLRAWLHKYVYQHHTGNLVEEMISDALTAANDSFSSLGGVGGQTVQSISDAVDDMDAFSRLGDWILQAIEASPDPKLHDARVILTRLRRRHLYASVLSPLELVDPVSEATIQREILSFVDGTEEQKQEAARAIVVHVANIDYGARDANKKPINPLQRVHFFNPKVDPTIAYGIDEKKFPPLFLPQTFGQRLLYVYTRNDEVHGCLELAFQRWKKKYIQKAQAKPGVDRASLLTPVGTGNPQSPQHARHRLIRQNSRPQPVPFRGINP
ncbi:SAM domain-containing protein [Salpingoeca rosetta]|uniref:SAM domain-containing protein n=1 Tax=Salpingoeca rosetta (strain ATCC 50818 / BSB-021) TaxID=946362 RepID=F2U9W6_SALR5|nr:SAM domain-containing protein [Salpingoeca rosetta]EGD73143.1 SAM domain-containing protein [Salpingoeca rosetta]|eukprot:XP_004994174.1 SAM domain-containing protein [Salpingoeca rosetta]